MTDRTFEFLSLLSYLYLEHGQPQRALRLLQVLAAARPDDRTTNMQLAYAWLEAGDANRGLEHVQRLLREFPDLHSSSALRLIRCRALWKLGQRDQARALALDWKRPERGPA